MGAELLDDDVWCLGHFSLDELAWMTSDVAAAIAALRRYYIDNIMCLVI